MADHTQKQNNIILSNWLFFTAFMVFSMAIIGAITRLTESGLSMVEWRPLIGALPPLSESEWMRVFALYQETPEYQHKNFGMSLSEFKTIFFWEWFHRLWGRLIGIVYALPLVYFWLRNMIPAHYKSKLLIGLALGGSQAIMGWYMVESGLVDRPSVSHFRLAAHLSLAFIIFGYLSWLAFSLKGTIQRYQGSFCLRRHGWSALCLLAMTIIWGAFVAGLNAGLVYNTYPLMGGRWIPLELNSFISIINDPAAIQFIHRWIAILAAFMTISFAWRVKNFPLMLAIFTQVGLGIATLLCQVTLPLAVMHQAGALVVFLCMTYSLFRISAKK